MTMKTAIRSLGIAACLLTLSACDDSKSEANRQPQVSAEQAEVLKYNEYVGTANMTQASFGDDLEKYRQYVQPVFDGKKKSDSLFFSSTSSMGRIKEKLDKARAMKPDMADLDAPAQTYSEALGKADPLYSDMANYIGAKTYLSDKGAHGREIQSAFIASMEAVTAAQAGFANAIDAKDRARIKAEFEKAEKDTIAYYQLGMSYHIKESMDLASGFLAGNGLGDKKEAFKTSLDQFNGMATNYENKVREKTKNGCSSLMLHVNAYLAKGREIIQDTESGKYEKDKKRPAQFQLMQSDEQRDASTLLQNFNNVINALNFNRC
ncbi:YiiG family protein [Neorhizobium alkalisoli]|uniref:Uncharacterized protein DUF3829 n=1 Tax=Neorhizobium alkalisoli TaxID=528178 RepID=A0A561R1N5_9HYPH|nr:YiiG family protein [Neorhizobium alkalisoli]TWF56473.1 uncharacterized protein DUF3829 [Neorhizobium alkalisoli]